MDTQIQKKKSKKGLGIALVVLVILIAAAFGVYSLVMNKPKNIFLKNTTGLICLCVINHTKLFTLN